MSQSRTTQHGFTLFEVVIVASLAAVAMLGLSTWTNRTQWLEKDARATMAVEHELRLNLQSVGSILRGSIASTLEAFGDTGRSTRPEFERVVDATAGTGTAGGAALLEWRAAAATVNGVQHPGDIHLVEDGSSRIVARAVPKGGFTVVRESSRTLEVELTTYAPGADPNTANQVSGTIVVYVRN